MLLVHTKMVLLFTKATLVHTETKILHGKMLLVHTEMVLLHSKLVLVYTNDPYFTRFLASRKDFSKKSAFCWRLEIRLLTIMVND